jgi:hypothetical protein
VEFCSLHDVGGHDTHTTTTTVGSVAYVVSMAEYALEVTRSMTPKVRVVACSVCWKGVGFLNSDRLMRFDRAVANGVDGLLVSISGGMIVAFYLDPIMIGAYDAISQGPTTMSVTNLTTWLANIGTNTIDRAFPMKLVLGIDTLMSSVSLFSGEPLPNASLPLYYPVRTGGLFASMCMENSLDPTLLKG